MKLTFKDLKQQKFVIEAEATELISEVKEKIQAEKGWEVALQKLIYSGKILQDGNTVESYKIEEKGFIVCMVSKPKAPPASAAPKVPSTPATAIIPSTPAQPAAPSQSNTASAPAVPETPTPAGAGVPSAPADAPGGGSSGLSMGSQRAAQIAELENMGFERTQIDAAMRAAFYNSERAVEYLLTGIPDNVQQQQPQRAATPAASQAPASPVPAAGGNDGGDDEQLNLFEAAAQAGGRGGAPSAGGAAAAGGLGNLMAGAGAGGAEGAAGLGNLDFLRNNPQFQTLRQVVQQQPHMLEPILQQVGAGNPQLAALIGQHPEQFLQLLSEDNDGDAPMPPGVQAISVTAEDQDAIERLTQLGFTRDQVIQAYIACDRNEELAANFLFEMPDDELE